MIEVGIFKFGDTLGFVIELVVSLALGMLIGLEREHSRADDRGKVVVAGIRSFSLVSISGFLLAFLSNTLDIRYLIPVGIGLFGAFSAVLFYLRYQTEMKGLTTSLAFFVTFLIGILVGLNQIFYGLAVAIVTTFLLATKHRLHDIAQVLTEDELLGALEFATLAFILLPLTYKLVVPSPYGDYIGAGKALDLFWLILIVIIVSMISLVSFIAIRRFGPARGLEFSGAMGGLINSEAATASLVGIAKRNKCVWDPVLTGILLANALMLLRNIAICAVADPSLKVLKLMLLPCIVMALSCLVFTRHFKSSDERTEKIDMKNPFAILPAFEFALIFSLIAAVAYGATNFPSVLGNGVAINFAVGFTAVGGLVSSGAVVAPLSALASNGHISVEIAAVVSTAACIVSTLNKILLVGLSSKQLARKIALPACVTAALGTIALVAAWLVFR